MNLDTDSGLFTAFRQSGQESVKDTSVNQQAENITILDPIPSDTTAQREQLSKRRRRKTKRRVHDSLRSLKGVDPHIVSLMAVDSPEAEQYRNICSRLEQMHKENSLALVAISSPIAGDGKTMTAINVAGTLAQFPDTKVILIDMDFRRPAVAKYLGITDGYSLGLGNLIGDAQLSLSKVVRHYAPFRLAILPAGQPSRTPHEVLKSRRLTSVLQEARELYDYVILDLPPMLFPDSRLLEHLVDGFVLVVSAHKTPKKLVEESLNILHPEKICGIILNNDDRPLFGYYSYYSYYYYNRPFYNEQPKATRWRTITMKNIFSSLRNEFSFLSGRVDARTKGNNNT